MSTDALSNPSQAAGHVLDNVSNQVARLEQIVAALVYVLYDGGSSPEIGDVQDALANWSMQEFHPDLLLESLSDHRQPLLAPCVRATGCAPELQRELFDAPIHSPSPVGGAS